MRDEGVDVVADMSYGRDVDVVTWREVQTRLKRLNVKGSGLYVCPDEIRVYMVIEETDSSFVTDLSKMTNFSAFK